MRELSCCLACAVLALTSVALSQPAEPLVLEDFSKPLGGRWKGGLELTEAEGGEKIGQWYGAREGDHLVLAGVPEDWTPYKALQFRVWSGAPNMQEFMVLVYAESPDTDEMDYFNRRIVVDWEGWKEFTVPLAAFRANRKAEWTAVDSLAFSTTGWGMEAKLDTDLYLGKISLLAEVPDAAKHPPDVVADFERDDFEVWDGLVRDTEHVKQGESAARWESLDSTRMVHAALDMDWAPYQFLEFDCYSVAPTGDRFIFCIVSMDQPRQRNDYWAYLFRVDWEGWKHFQIPFRRLHKLRNPLGWQRVTGIEMYPNGWGMQPNPSPDTVLVFDDMRLTKGEPRSAPPGMIDDFEDGPWAWWWMDEGSVPAKVGEHCGELPLHEGWRQAEGDSFPTADWTPYQTMKLWVYAKALPGEVLQVGAYGDGGRWTGEAPLDGEGWREVTLPLTPNPGKVFGISLRIKGLDGDDNGKANRDLDPAAKLCLDDMRLE